VVRATLAELADDGYAGLSIESIAGRAGVNKTTLYRRWGTRDELVLEVMLATGRERVPIPDTGSLRDDLLAYGRAIIAGSRTRPPRPRAVAAAGGHYSGLADASRRFWAERLSLASEIVKRAAARGEIRTPTDPALVVELVIAPIYFRLLMSGGVPK
jgi:AcrR family transcriptional regulator